MRQSQFRSIRQPGYRPIVEDLHLGPSPAAGHQERRRMFADPLLALGPFDAVALPYNISLSER